MCSNKTQFVFPAVSVIRDTHRCQNFGSETWNNWDPMPLFRIDSEYMTLFFGHTVQFLCHTSRHTGSAVPHLHVDMLLCCRHTKLSRGVSLSAGTG